MSAEATYLYKADLALLASDIEARANGNPGALNVMCLGVLEFGREFYDRIARAGLTGAAIWEKFKDEHGQDFGAMHEALGGADARPH